MRFRRCAICGIPKQVARLNRWMPNGTISGLGDPLIRQVFFEAELLPEIRRRISEGLGFPVNRIFYEAERNAVQAVVASFINPIGHRLALRVAPFKRGTMRFLIRMAAITGIARARGVRYHPGKYGMARIYNPWDLDLTAAVVVGAFEVLEKKPLRSFWKKDGDGYVLRVEVTENKPEISERLKLEFPPLKEGEFRHHRCPRCGVPLQMKHLEWREEEGVIIDRRRGIRMINWEGHSVSRVIRELVAELGEEVVPIIVDAERERTLRMLEDLGYRESTEEQRSELLQEMLAMLPLYGYGLATEVEFTPGGVLRVWIDNPYDEYLLAGRLGAFYQAMEGRRARIEWSRAGPSTISYLLTPMDERQGQ